MSSAPGAHWSASVSDAHIPDVTIAARDASPNPARRAMPRREALRHHASFDISAELAFLLPACVGIVAWMAGMGLAAILAAVAAALAGTGLVLACIVDMRSRRIPNRISLAVLLAAPAWWTAGLIDPQLVEGAGRVALGPVLAFIGMGADEATMVGDVTAQYPVRIAWDAAAAIIVFVPVYASFILRLGFGGGDVKLIVALAPFLGWPLAVDFLALTFLMGGVLALGPVGAKIAAGVAGSAAPHALRRLAGVREIPYAPAILVGAMICFAVKMQGVMP